jgi:hypothetical protein
LLDGEWHKPSTEKQVTPSGTEGKKAASQLEGTPCDSARQWVGLVQGTVGVAERSAPGGMWLQMNLQAGRLVRARPCESSVSGQGREGTGPKG